jgi:hypothetical protein
MHLDRLEQIVGSGLQQCGGFFRRSSPHVEPRREMLGSQNYRHAVVQSHYRAIGRTSQDRDGIDLTPFPSRQRS